jgi:hypothetical protein
LKEGAVILIKQPSGLFQLRDPIAARI